jgi:stage II sporulation protein D
MCQVGAMGRARAGHSYTEILRSYYTGVEVRRLY